MIVVHIKPADLENYQAKRKREGYSDSYVDQEIGAARTMINKAFDNDMVGGDTLKVFKKVKKLLKRNANARDRILTAEEFKQLMQHCPCIRGDHRHGLLYGNAEERNLSLTWDKVDLKKERSGLRQRTRRTGSRGNSDL